MGNKTPLFFQSKLLCFSLLYLFTTLFLSLYPSSQCLFRSSPFDPLQTTLFTYPSSYGQHKHALTTHHSSCSSPLFFSDYKSVLSDIQKLINSPPQPQDLKYTNNSNSDTFGGNFNTRIRFSHFHNFHNSNKIEIPCGFLKTFPIKTTDKIAMENCKGVVVVSAIFNNHDKIRQPRGLGHNTLQTVCFFMFVDDITLSTLDSHSMLSPSSKLGVWRLVKVTSKKLYDNPAMNGVIPKYLVHRLFPNSKFSVWIDAKMQLTVDPLLLIHSLVVSKNADVAISRHPYFVHTMEEAVATARWKKWRDVELLQRQMETYCRYGLQLWSSRKLPYLSDVPDSALIIRKHVLSSNLFSCLVFNELEAFNPRDQLAFAFVRDSMRPKIKLNMFPAEVLEHVAMEYRHSIKKDGGLKSKSRRYDFFVNSNTSNCWSYLSKMWSESH